MADAPANLTVSPAVVAAAIDAGVIIAAHDLPAEGHESDCCGCLVINGKRITCNECGFVFAENVGYAPVLKMTDPHERIDRVERMVGELQRHLREFNGFAPSRELDLIDLR